MKCAATSRPPADREVVLHRLYWNAKDQRDWRLASAHSINDDREGSTPWADRLAAHKVDWISYRLRTPWLFRPIVHRANTNFPCKVEFFFKLTNQSDNVPRNITPLSFTLLYSSCSGGNDGSMYLVSGLG